MSSPAHITHKVMENWGFFINTLNLLLRNFVKRIQTNGPKYTNQVLASCHVTTHLTTAQTPFILVYGRDPSLTTSPIA